MRTSDFLPRLLWLSVSQFMVAAALLLSPQAPASANDAATTSAAKSSATETPVERGYRLLRTKTYLPADFDQQVFDELWQAWPEPLRSDAKAAATAERRRMTFSRYGLIDDLDNASGQGLALGYVDDGQGGWVMNCLACHGGKVAGQVIPGLPNTHFGLQTLVEDVRLTKLRLSKPLGHLDLGSLKIPLGTTHGTTNSVVFGIVLGALRDRDMNVDGNRTVPKQVHHDMDAPPFWNVRKKSRLYADGFAPKNHRVLMQFILLPQNGPDTLAEWEDDFRDILAWIESVQPPEYPWPIDAALAKRGEAIFVEHCSKCHGTYGPDGTYEQINVALDVVGTDPLRLQALTSEHRQWMRDGWLSRHGQDPVELEPRGYVAPPLDGVWASAPYFHNGSIPTLWHVLHPEERPAVWKRFEDGYDQQRVGLEVTEYLAVPAGRKSAAERRQFFEASQPGKSAAGHLFPQILTKAEKLAVLEYLKTL